MAIRLLIPVLARPLIATFSRRFPVVLGEIIQARAPESLGGREITEEEAEWILRGAFEGLLPELIENMIGGGFRIRRRREGDG